MKRVQLSKADLTKELSEKIWFFKIADGGAMGDPGGVTIITSDGVMGSFHYGHKDVDYEDVTSFFPVFTQCMMSAFGGKTVSPKGWKYVYLGYGNHLVVSEEVYGEFFEEVKDLKGPSEVYAAWRDKAEKIVRKRLGKKVQNGITEIVFILDKSGSMSGREEDVIGGFNATMEKQRKEDGKAIVSTVLFDDEIEVLYDRIPLEDVPTMTDKEYQVRGTTALLDAIGGGIDHIGRIHKYSRPEEVPEHTLFIITTDGLENASMRYSSNRVKKMIQHQQDRYGWEFIFLAANIDAVQTASRYGIRMERAVDYEQSEEGIRMGYCMMNEAISRVRKRETLDDEGWKLGKKKK